MIPTTNSSFVATMDSGNPSIGVDYSIIYVDKFKDFTSLVFQFVK